MKAKRIVSILLTGSMLLSLLPVSALAAAPVFDAPAQTTAKKAAPLVQEADVSRSTEEEAATRSSRDLDAENNTAESITIDLDAKGNPTSQGDVAHWYYNATALFLNSGTFTLQPSSEPGAASALQPGLFIKRSAEFKGGTAGNWTTNRGTISGGTFQGEASNQGTISDGTFQGAMSNDGTISGGTFQGDVNNNYRGTISGGTFQGEASNRGTISGGTFQGEASNRGTISGGTFEKKVLLMNGDASITISDGLFDGVVVNKGRYGSLSITGGLFTKDVDVYTISTGNLSITGGYFVAKPIMPQGSNTGFATVRDQNGRTFQVPVNEDFSENGYGTLYVPHGTSEQANPITVKTDTVLTDCLADGESIMDSVQQNADGSYTIEVSQPKSIVLVTEEPAPPTPDKPTPPTPDKPTPPTPDEPGELDPAFSSGAAALGIVLGTAGLGYATYVYGSSLYLHYALPGGFIPSTRQELATVLWTTAGKPDPVSTALYTDIPADAIEQQKAARWCAEQGLLSDHGATFGPDTKVTNARIIRAWNSLKKVPVTITK